MIKCHDKRCRRDSSRIVRYFESRTSDRAKRRVTLPSISGWSSVCRCPQLGRSKRRRSHTSGAGRPRGRSPNSTRRVSWTLEVLSPHTGHRTTGRVSATSMTNLSISSSRTRTTRIRLRCSRIVIPSVARAGSPRRPYRPTIAASDAHAVDGGETPAQAPNPNHPRSLRLVTMVRQIARAGGWRPRWKMAVARARIAAAISLSRARYHKSGKYSATRAGLRSSTRPRQRRWR